MILISLKQTVLKEQYWVSTDSKRWDISDECPYIDLRSYDSYEAFLGYFKSKYRQ